jgi:hypothetical protein
LGGAGGLADEIAGSASKTNRPNTNRCIFAMGAIRVVDDPGLRPLLKSGAFSGKRLESADKFRLSVLSTYLEECLEAGPGAESWKKWFCGSKSQRP